MSCQRVNLDGCPGVKQELSRDSISTAGNTGKGGIFVESSLFPAGFLLTTCEQQRQLLYWQLQHSSYSGMARLRKRAHGQPTATHPTSATVVMDNSPKNRAGFQEFGRSSQSPSFYFCPSFGKAHRPPGTGRGSRRSPAHKLLCWVRFPSRGHESFCLLI